MKLLSKMIERNELFAGHESGWGNGYVMLPKDHPMFGVHYNDIPVGVHGGLTYSEEKDGLWVVGFDTAHAGDNAENADIFYVAKETLILKKQLEDMV